MKECDDEYDASLDKICGDIKKLEDAITFIRPFKEIINIQNKNVINIADKQAHLLEKFKYSEQLFETLALSKSATSFKINLYEFLTKYFALKKFTLISNYFLKRFKSIKIVCRENVNLFGH